MSAKKTTPNKKTVFLRLTNSRAGKLYAEATTDFTVKKGERFMVLDPRKFLSEEQVSELEEKGELQMKTPSGKEYKIYASLFAEIAHVAE